MHPPHAFQLISDLIAHELILTPSSPLHRDQMAIFIIPRFEKGIRQDDTVDPLHLRIIRKVIIQKEKHRHINLSSLV